MIKIKLFLLSILCLFIFTGIGNASQLGGTEVATLNEDGDFVGDIKIEKSCGGVTARHLCTDGEDVYFKQDDDDLLDLGADGADSYWSADVNGITITDNIGINVGSYATYNLYLRDNASSTNTTSLKILNTNNLSQNIGINSTLQCTSGTTCAALYGYADDSNGGASGGIDYSLWLQGGASAIAKIQVPVYVTGGVFSEDNDGDHGMLITNSGAYSGTDFDEEGGTAFNLTTHKWHVHDGTDMNDELVTNDGSNSDSGIVRWGSAPDTVDTGSELCALNHETCVDTCLVTTTECDLTASDCSTVHGGMYQAYCY